jgi:hypothetical protein
MILNILELFDQALVGHEISEISEPPMITTYIEYDPSQ